MSDRRAAARGHIGHTITGNTCDLKVKRVGKVTIYRRGLTYWVYYREDGASVRRALAGQDSNYRRQRRNKQRFLPRAMQFGCNRGGPMGPISGWMKS